MKHEPTLTDRTVASNGRSGRVLREITQVCDQSAQHAGGSYTPAGDGQDPASRNILRQCLASIPCAAGVCNGRRSSGPIRPAVRDTGTGFL